jgi:DNA polymerase III gamma/tau subunit
MAQAESITNFLAALDQHQAHLALGSPTSIGTILIDYLQKKWCPKNSCKACHLCIEIAQKKHHALYWAQPENSYTLDMIDELLAQTAFSLADTALSFIVIDQADRLSAACANRMLKIVEEPPEGYRFIFIAQRIDAVLPTIRSRCIITHLETEKTVITHPVVTALLSHQVPSADQFLKLLETHELKEQESNDLIDYLLGHWLNIEKNEHAAPESQKHTARRIAILKKALAHPPMPGSSKIFWKNLYLQMLRINHP